MGTLLSIEAEALKEAEALVEKQEKKIKEMDSFNFDSPNLPPPKGPKALSMNFMKALSGLCYCPECGTDPLEFVEKLKDDDADQDAPSELYNFLHMQRNITSISPLVSAPMMTNETSTSLTESIIGQYMCLCQFYKVPYNAGILTTLRFKLPSLRVSGSFHDTDMLVLTELLLKHANQTLKFIRRLDFSMASKEGKQFKSIKLGFTSHGALALAKTLQQTKYITQVWLPRHRVGPYGASALFWACSANPSIQDLRMRRCRIGERGAFAFCELIMNGDKNHSLKNVDLSANGIGHRGTTAIEQALNQRNNGEDFMFVNLEGNLVFPEIMNGVTHGMGLLLSILGGVLMSDLVKDSTQLHKISCAVYTTSLLVLYLSSTLYHSFFILQHTKYVFMVFDKCAIYILIAGSYTPFMQLLLGDQPIWSVGMLGFIWTCCFLGMSVEAFAPTWDKKKYFSLCMYIGMGWAALVCLPHMKERMPQAAVNYLILGGVGYTAGIPFFIRNNFLDHAIWHLFVMVGSICHWLAVYLYVAPRKLEW